MNRQRKLRPQYPAREGLIISGDPASRVMERGSAGGRMSRDPADAVAHQAAFVGRATGRFQSPGRRHYEGRFGRRQMEDVRPWSPPRWGPQDFSPERMYDEEPGWNMQEGNWYEGGRSPHGGFSRGRGGYRRSRSRSRERFFSPGRRGRERGRGRGRGWGGEMREDRFLDFIEPGGWDMHPGERPFDEFHVERGGGWMSPRYSRERSPCGSPRQGRGREESPGFSRWDGPRRSPRDDPRRSPRDDPRRSPRDDPRRSPSPRQDRSSPRRERGFDSVWGRLGPKYERSPEPPMRAPSWERNRRSGSPIGEGRRGELEEPGNYDLRNAPPDWGRPPNLSPPQQGPRGHNWDDPRDVQRAPSPNWGPPRADHSWDGPHGRGLEGPMYDEGGGNLRQMPIYDEGGGNPRQMPMYDEGGGNPRQMPIYDEGGGNPRQMPIYDEGGGNPRQMPMYDEGGGNPRQIPIFDEGGGNPRQMPGYDEGGGNPRQMPIYDEGGGNPRQMPGYDEGGGNPRHMPSHDEGGGNPRPMPTFDGPSGNRDWLGPGPPGGTMGNPHGEQSWGGPREEQGWSTQRPTDNTLGLEEQQSMDGSDNAGSFDPPQSWGVPSDDSDGFPDDPDVEDEEADTNPQDGPRPFWERNVQEWDKPVTMAEIAAAAGKPPKEKSEKHVNRKKGPLYDREKQAAVVLEDPGMRLTKKDGNYIRQCLVRDVQHAISQRNGPELRFLKSGVVGQGWFMVSCGNKVTIDWLLQWQPPRIENQNLIVKRRSEIPDLNKIGFWMSRVELTVPEILRILKGQNGRLETKNWVPIGRTRGKHGIFLTFLIDEESLKALKSYKWSMCFELHTVRVYKLKSSQGKGKGPKGPMKRSTGPSFRQRIGPGPSFVPGPILLPGAQAAAGSPFQ